MNEQEVLHLLGKVSAVITGSHIVYTSGQHGKAYINKDAVYPNTTETSLLCRAIAELFRDDIVDVVIAPAIGGVILSQWTAHHLSEIFGRPILGFYAEKEVIPISDPDDNNRKCFVETGNFVIKRGYAQLVANKNVLVVEDVLTTGGSAKKVIEATRAIGGNVIGLGVLCNRGGITPEDVAKVPKLIALVNVQLEAWDESACPLCERNIPINTDIGKGREYLMRTQG